MPLKPAIRYSQAFKLQVVREVETGQHGAQALQRKYGIRGKSTVMQWVRQYGRGQIGKIIRVERPQEINELARLRTQLRQAKEALADAHLELALERGYLAVACERLDQRVEDFKKKVAGRRRTPRSGPPRS